MDNIFEITARIQMLRTEEGGRKGPILSGYRPHLTFDGETFTDCGVQISNKEWLYPGEEAEVTLRLVHPEYVKEYLKVDQKFLLYEGSKKVASGVIVKVGMYR